MCQSVRRCKFVVHTVSTSCRRPVLKLYCDISTWATMHGTKKGQVLYSIRGTIHIDCNKCTLKVQHTLYNHTLQPSSGGRICVTGQWTVIGHPLYIRRPSRLGAPAMISADRIPHPNLALVLKEWRKPKSSRPGEGWWDLGHQKWPKADMLPGGG